MNLFFEESYLSELNFKGKAKLGVLFLCYKTSQKLHYSQKRTLLSKI